MSADALAGIIHAERPGQRFQQHLDARGSVVYETRCGRSVSLWERTVAPALVTCGECLDELDGTCLDCEEPADDIVPAPRRATSSRSSPRPVGARVIVLHGPLARATAWASAESGDLVIDLSRLVGALTSTPALDQPDHVRHVALGAYQAALDRASRLREDVDVWFVHPDATDEQLRKYADRGFILRPPP
jgi:hypothetical protein